MPEERLHKFLARAGVASRRASEELIRTGRVAVDGRVVTEMGVRIDPSTARVTVDGRPATVAARPVYLALNKPRDYVTTAGEDPLGRPTVMELVRRRERLYPVGRLDAATEGLLILTNDGELAHRMMHPRYYVQKEYIAKVRGVPGPEALQRLRGGVPTRFQPTPAQPHRVEVIERLDGDASLLRIVIHEGAKHQVRDMIEEVGHPVLTLRRTRIGPIFLGELRRGETRELTWQEVAALREMVRLETEPTEAPQTPAAEPGRVRPRPTAPRQEPIWRRKAAESAPSTARGPDPARTDERPMSQAHPTADDRPAAAPPPRSPAEARTLPAEHPRQPERPPARPPEREPRPRVEDRPGSREHRPEHPVGPRADDPARPPVRPMERDAPPPARQRPGPPRGPRAPWWADELDAHPPAVRTWHAPGARGQRPTPPPERDDRPPRRWTEPGAEHRPRQADAASRPAARHDETRPPRRDWPERRPGAEERGRPPSQPTGGSPRRDERPPSERPSRPAARGEWSGPERPPSGRPGRPSATEHTRSGAPPARRVNDWSRPGGRAEPWRRDGGGPDRAGHTAETGRAAGPPRPHNDGRGRPDRPTGSPHRDEARPGRRDVDWSGRPANGSGRPPRGPGSPPRGPGRPTRPGGAPRPGASPRGGRGR